MNIWQYIKVGGATMYVLLFFSVVSLTIIAERLFYYHKRSRIRRESFMQAIGKALARKDLKEAVTLCEHTDTPFAEVVYAGLDLFSHDEAVISNAMERRVTIETTKLEQYTGILGTIGSTAVYIGLFGTVLGIIRAFRDISTAGSGGISVVINGISEALVCTAAGLCVAVPAVIMYNYLIRKIDTFVTDMELSASEMMDLVKAKQK